MCSMRAQSSRCREPGVPEATVPFCLSHQNEQVSMESIRYSEIAALEEMEKDKFCRVYGFLPCKHFKCCGAVELCDKIMTFWAG